MRNRKVKRKKFNIHDEARVRERQMRALKNFRLLDDTFMKVVMEDKACVKCVLDTILDADLTILEHKTEFVLANLHGGGVRLDVFAQDELGRMCNIEVQRADEGAQPKRARRNSSFLDANHPDPGEYGENLRETYVIFITEGDPLGFGLPIYHITRKIEENGESFQDGTHIIYANTGVQDVSTSLGRLMHDFTMKSASEMYNSVLADRVKRLKETKEGYKDMCRIMEEMLREEREEMQEEYICRLARKLSSEEIAELLEIPIEDVTEILEENEILPIKESQES